MVASQTLCAKVLTSPLSSGKVISSRALRCGLLNRATRWRFRRCSLSAKYQLLTLLCFCSAGHVTWLRRSCDFNILCVIDFKYINYLTMQEGRLAMQPMARGELLLCMFASPDTAPGLLLAKVRDSILPWNIFFGFLCMHTLIVFLFYCAISSRRSRGSWTNSFLRSHHSLQLLRHLRIFLQMHDLFPKRCSSFDIHELIVSHHWIVWIVFIFCSSLIPIHRFDLFVPDAYKLKLYHSFGIFISPKNKF